MAEIKVFAALLKMGEGRGFISQMVILRDHGCIPIFLMVLWL
jgi:hypothetical protein